MRVQVQKKKIPILMYHSISYTVNPRFRKWTVPSESFAEQMAYLHQHAYTPITVTQLVRARSQEAAALPARPVVLTFDDGFADFFTAALPVLRQYNFTATLYVPTAFIDGTSRWLRSEMEAERLMLTWKQLAEISASCIECGAHSHSHPQLNTLPYSSARDEIVLSKRLLEDHLGQEISSFAYPFGYHTAAIRHLVREAGYTSACITGGVMSTEAEDPFALSRLGVYAESTLEEFAAMLTGRGSSPVTAVYKLYKSPVTAVYKLYNKIYAHARNPVRRLVGRCSASGSGSFEQDSLV